MPELPVQFNDIENKDGFTITVSVKGTAAATGGNYTHFFIARHPFQISWISEVHAVKGSDGSAVTLDVVKLTDTTAPGSGTTILLSTFDLKGDINTVVTKKGSRALATNRFFKEGNRIALKTSGTLTAVDSVLVTLFCGYIGRGSYQL